MPNYGKYEYLKIIWVAKHPNSTPEEYQKAIRKIAKICGV